MANPFISKFNSECQNCDSSVSQGEEMYAVNGSFVCTGCAVEGNNVCACGAYKKEQFPRCYNCTMEKKAGAPEVSGTLARVPKKVAPAIPDLDTIDYGDTSINIDDIPF